MTRPAAIRRGSVVVVALWAIAVAAIVTSSIQIFAHRQALLGIESRDRIRARWAARAGLESTMAAMAEHTAMPIPQDAFALIRDLEGVSSGALEGADWDIRHHLDGRDWRGPMDEHGKFNINSEDNAIFLLIIDELAFGVMEAIQDWMDEDDDPRELGVERDYYLSLDNSYEPRNGLLRSIAELELIAGVMPNDVRGEDWDLDYRLDANEDDGGGSLPWDEPDGVLEGGWASMLTTASRDGGPTESGELRIDLRSVDPEILEIRLLLEPAQAAALIQWANTTGAAMSALLSQSLRSLSGDAGGVSNLTDQQMRAVFDETSLLAAHEWVPGRMNINTVSPELLYRLFPEDATLVEELLYLRTNNAGGIASPVDFLSIPGIQPSMATFLADLFDTRSSVFTVSVRGEGGGSGVQHEIIATVDRSTLPVTILEYREQ